MEQLYTDQLCVYGSMYFVICYFEAFFSFRVCVCVCACPVCLKLHLRMRWRRFTIVLNIINH